LAETKVELLFLDYSHLNLTTTEIRRTIQILSRRTKSNPVLIGPPGVGKTAILEGLASRIVMKQVPDSLHDKRVLSIDLSSVISGSAVRGQFEEKFKALLKDIEDEAGKIICFIDEIRACILILFPFTFLIA
jgi:ATP-dependent Clp protease ATP-binding subunit ClpB